jgi:WD40 repeat protein
MVTGGAFLGILSQIHSVSEDGKYRVWDLDRCEPYVILGAIPNARGIGYSEDGKALLIADREGEVHWWDLESSQKLEPVPQPPGFRTLAFSAEGTVHAGVSEEGFAAVWNVRNGRSRESSMTIAKSDESFMVVSGDGSTVAWMSGDGVHVWNHERNRQMHLDVGDENLPTYARDLHLPALSSSGERLVVTGTERHFSSELWNIADELPERVWPEPLKGGGPERQAAFSKDGKLLAIGNWDTDVRLHQVESGELLRTLKGHSQPVEALAFSRDGTRLVSIGGDHKLCIWDVETGGLLSAMQGYEDRAIMVVWSPEGDSIAAQSADGTVKVWTAARAVEVDQDTSHLRNRASHFAKLGRWSQAAVYHRRTIELDPNDEMNWMRTTGSLVAARDLEAYHDLCGDMLERFADSTTQEVVDRVVKSCLIIPPAEARLPEIMKLAKVAVNDPNHWAMPYARMTRGLADYRASDFQAAQDWSHRALEKPPAWFIGAQANLVLAMSEKQLGRTEAAQDALDKATEILDAQSPNFTGSSLGRGWHDWFFSQALLSEAEALINSGK